MYKTLLFEIRNHIARITINRPHVGNALETMTTYYEILDAMGKCDKDENVKVAVITGAGKNFSAGGDISEFSARIADGTCILEDEIRTANAMAESIKRCSKPVIAMVNGAAAGAGMSLALACDFRVMATSSKMIMAFIKMGLSGDTGGIFNLVQIIGPAKALEFMMLGDTIGGEEACRLGIAYRVCQPEKLEEETMALAARLANGPGFAYKKQKQLMWECFCQAYAPYTGVEGAYMRQCSLSEDFSEAVSAFLGKRTPRFQGK